MKYDMICHNRQQIIIIYNNYIIEQILK